jgi:acetate kinase
MGFTPLEGLVMGTRTGDIDPAVVFHLARSGHDLAGIEDLFKHHSGLFGLCGDNDLRAVESRARQGDPAAALALDVYCHRIRRYVGAYLAVLGRLDAIVFTAGVGEHSALVRHRSLTGLHALGIQLDPTRNAEGTGERVVSPGSARVRVCVVPTDEERAIADETAEALGLDVRGPGPR